MTDHAQILSADFRALSAALGQDPLQVQGPGGNTSIKQDDVMWIKASGTELADAVSSNIFVAVNRDAARAEALGQVGDGSCKSTVLDPAVALRPSIETTFHAALNHRVVAHTHSVATLAHVICHEGRLAADEKLQGLPFVRVPYAKPGLPLTREILARTTPETQVILLENHGLICCGDTSDEVRKLIAEVEHRLQMPVRGSTEAAADAKAPTGFVWSDYGWMATTNWAMDLVTGGSYYPDHVVFLGPALPLHDHDGDRPAILVPRQGVAIKSDATSSQVAMLRCVSDVLCRIPSGWVPEAIGREAEAELLNWDAEKYRQALAAKP